MKFPIISETRKEFVGGSFNEKHNCRNDSFVLVQSLLTIVTWHSIVYNQRGHVITLIWLCIENHVTALFWSQKGNVTLSEYWTGPAIKPSG